MLTSKIKHTLTSTFRPIVHGMFRHKTLMGMITLIVGIFITTALLAAPIGLDPTFGTGGMTITDFDTGSGIDCDVATDVVIQPDGKIILGGEQDNCADFVYKFSLARYNPDGTLDPNFGTGGLVLIDGSHDQDWGNALTLQPDGKILIAGTGDRFGFFEVLRLDPNGVLDPTFGVNGTVLTSLGTDYQMGYDIALQLDGKIVVAGAAGPSFDNADFALVRYNSDGSIDSTFGVGGIVTTSFTADSDDAANTLVIQPDGKIVAAGKSRNLTPPAGVTDFALARYNSDGTLDLTFNGTGLVTTSLATTHNEVLNLVLQPDNKLITSGKASDANKSHLGVARYNTDGGLDTSFDGDGKFISQLDSQTMAGESILVLPDNKIMVGGYGGGAHPANMALALFNSDGSPDTSFDGDGFMFIDINEGYDFIEALALQPDNKIIAAGHTQQFMGDTNYLVARFGELLPQNLIVNGGFEDADDTGQPAWWYGKNLTEGEDKRIVNEPEKIVAHSGDAAFQFKGGANKNSRLTQNPPLDNVSLTTGDEVVLQAFVQGKEAAPDGAIIAVLKYADPASANTKLTLTVPEGTYDYTALASSSVAVTSTIQKVKIRLIDKMDSGKFWLDDVSLTLTKGGESGGDGSLIPLPASK